MSKPYQTSTQTPAQPTRNDPETYTVKRMKTLGMWTLAVCVVIVGWWLHDLTGWLPVALVSIVVSVALFVAGGLLLEYSNRAIERDLPRQQRKQGAAPVEREHVIYTHNEVTPKTGGGYTVEQSKHEARFTDGAREVARGVAWMLKHGRSDRRSLQAGLGWSPDKFNRIMSELATFGMATNTGRGTGNGWKIDPKAYDWTQSLEAEIDDLFDQLDRM